MTQLSILRLSQLINSYSTLQNLQTDRWRYTIIHALILRYDQNLRLHACFRKYCGACSLSSVGWLSFPFKGSEQCLGKREPEAMIIDGGNQLAWGLENDEQSIISCFAWSNVVVIITSNCSCEGSYPVRKARLFATWNQLSHDSHHERRRPAAVTWWDMNP